MDLWLWLQVYKADIFKCQQVDQLVLMVGRTLPTFVTVHLATPWIFDRWLCYTFDVQPLVCLNIGFITVGFARSSKTIYISFLATFLGPKRLSALMIHCGRGTLEAEIVVIIFVQVPILKTPIDRSLYKI